MNHTFWYTVIAKNCWYVLSHHTSLLSSNLFLIISQPIHMIEADTGDDADISVEDIHRVQPTPQTDL